MITLSAAVMHAPWATERASWVRGIVHQLRDAHRCTLVRDHNRAGIWPTARAAWRLASGTHHLVVQDDVELCDDFLTHATAAIAARPNAAISFFGFAKKAMLRAVEHGVPWVGIDGHMTAQALCLPTPWVDTWLRWCEEMIEPSYPHDDARLRVWLAYQDLPMWFTMPCLVEHLGDKTSIAGNHPPLARTAPLYTRRMTTVDWTRGVGEGELRIRMKSRRDMLTACTGVRVSLLEDPHDPK